MGASGVLVGLALAASVAGVAVLMMAVSRRWFARFRRGFLLSLMVALAGTGLAIAAVLGVWAYTEERDTLLGQIVSEMTHIAQIEQNEIKEDIADAQTSLQFFATRMAEDARRNPAAVRERLRELQAFDPRFLQVSLMDAEGRILVSSSVAGEVEPANRIGVAHTLDGKPFVSDIYLSPLFKRWVIYISAPVKDAKGAVTGAVSARFDMQEDLKAFVRMVRFGADGYTMIANGDGRIIGHPDEARLDTDVSAYPVVRAALQGRTTNAIGANLAGTEMLMVGQPFESPSTLRPKPWVLVAEMATAEALAPVRALRVKFALAALVAGAACLAVVERSS